MAAIFGNVAVAEALVSHGADLHARCIRLNATALHYATGHEQPAVVSLLASLGADLHARDEYGDTPLHYAALSHSAQAAAALLRAGASRAVFNEDGVSKRELERII